MSSNQKITHQKHPPPLCIFNYGWQPSTSGLVPTPAYGVKEVVLSELLKVVACGCTAEPQCSQKTGSCNESVISWTSYCKCQCSTDSPHMNISTYEYLHMNICSNVGIDFDDSDSEIC